eukprot:SAG11_NODE_8180_length_1051_cov_0.973739_1_plen_33_part_10
MPLYADTNTARTEADAGVDEETAVPNPSVEDGI